MARSLTFGRRAFGFPRLGRARARTGGGVPIEKTLSPDIPITSESNGGNSSGRNYLIHLAVGAVGVVYGDIGTSPLYALRECFQGPHAVEVSVENVFGVLSCRWCSGR